MLLLSITILILSIIFLFQLWNKNKDSPPIRAWPIFGMAPGLLLNAHRIHDFAADVMNNCKGTFMFGGPLLFPLNFLVTADPANVNHMLCRNFSNYAKGADFKEIFNPLGEGIFNADSDSWKTQRRLIHTIMNNGKYETYASNIILRKALEGLAPILEHFSKEGTVLDLQDVCNRFNFDTVCIMVMGHDPCSTSVDLPKVEFSDAIEVMEETVLYRHCLPISVWKTQKRLQIGEERAMTIASNIVDNFIYQCISRKREKIQKMKDLHMEEKEAEAAEAEEEFQDTLTKLINSGNLSNQMLRDYMFNLLTAGRDTVAAGMSWFFWEVARHPRVESLILDEIERVFPTAENPQQLTDKKRLDQMLYLQAALCETLRLYPSVPINHKCSVEADTLPSGHHLPPNTRVLITFYGMARMKEIWGDDCLEFKPERWITTSDSGVRSIVHVPSHKFTAFNAGPRTCLGKELSFIELKIAAITVLRKYRVELVEGHPVYPCSSVILHMKKGLKVRIVKRSK